MNDYSWVIRQSKVWLDWLETQGSDFMWPRQYFLHQTLFVHPWLQQGVCSPGTQSFWSSFEGNPERDIQYISLLSLQMNRTKGDEEEYWNSSKFKAFTFDDEDDELSQVGFCEHSPKFSPLSTVYPFPCILGNLSKLGSAVLSVTSLEDSSWRRTLGKERNCKSQLPAHFPLHS